MTDAQFKAETAYQTSASILRTLKAQGLLTDKEYQKIDLLLLKKYQPLVGSLYN